MIGPIGAAELLHQTYIRYLLSAHPIGIMNPELAQSLRAFLATPSEQGTKLLVRGPILELDPASIKGETVRQLVDEGTLSPEFLDLAHGDLGRRILERKLYTHQVSALRAAAKGKSVVVASGTGSGKTEAWLYAVASRLAAETRIKAKPGIRAIVLYPMNALADDQRRGRFRQIFAGSNITFGEYTGNTTGSGRRDSIDPNAPQNELLTRTEMRATPPNILMTNPSMLEYLLLRPRDESLFTGAQLRFLVLDEAHTYRGAYGIELASLLRRLQARLSTDPTRFQAFILSATIDHDIPQICRFASDLTGLAFTPDTIFFGALETFKSEQGSFLNPRAYECLTNTTIESVVGEPTALLDQSDVVAAFGEERVFKAAGAGSGTAALWALLHDNGHVLEIRDKLKSGPQPLEKLARDLVGPVDFDVDATFGRLIDAAATARENPDDSALLPARYHTFLRGLDGLFLCFSAEHTGVGLGTHRVGSWRVDRSEFCNCGLPMWEWARPRHAATDFCGVGVVS